MIRQRTSTFIASPGNKVGEGEVYCGIRVFTFRQPLKVTEAIEILKIIKPDVVHAHGFKAVFTEACRKINIPCIITAHHGGILCPAGALLNYRDDICKIKANHKDCLPCVLKNIRGGFYVWPVLRLIPLKFRLVLGRLMDKLPFILYITPVFKTTLSIQNKIDEWRTIHENASLIIAPSFAISESMIMNGALTEKIKVLPHGIPLPKKSYHYEQIIEEKKAKQQLRFFYIGRICHIKGIHIMLDAFNRINCEAELHIIGGSENKGEELYKQRQQKKYRLNSHIIWHGKVEREQIFNIIQQYDIMIHPAICLEIFGLNIAEALAMCKPVIATRCGGAEMQIKNGINGWIIEPNDVNELKNKIETIISEPLVHMVKIESSCAKDFSIEEHVRQLKMEYMKVVNEKSSY